MSRQLRYRAIRREREADPDRILFMGRAGGIAVGRSLRLAGDPVEPEKHAGDRQPSGGEARAAEGNDGRGTRGRGGKAVAAGAALKTKRLAQRGVDLLKRSRAGAQLFLVESIERRLDRIEMAVQILRVGFHVQKARDDLSVRGVVLQKAHGSEPVVDVVF